MLPSGMRSVQSQYCQPPSSFASLWQAATYCCNLKCLDELLLLGSINCCAIYSAAVGMENALTRDRKPDGFLGVKQWNSNPMLRHPGYAQIAGFRFAV